MVAIDATILGTLYPVAAWGQGDELSPDTRTLGRKRLRIAVGGVYFDASPCGV
jgi:hypothetical protein